MDQAIMGCGGGLAVRLASLFRFWTVAVRRNSSLAPVRPVSLLIGVEIGSVADLVQVLSYRR